MAVGYRSSSTSGTSDAFQSTVTVPVPAGAAADDIALLAIKQWESTNPTVTWPAGFTEKLNLTSGVNLKLKVAWKRLTGADSGSYVPTWTGSQWTMGHCILITGGIKTGDPIEVTNTANGASTTVPTTTVTTATLPFLAHFVYNDDVAATGTPPTSFTEVQDSDYLKTNYWIPGVSGVQTASGATVTPSATLIVALLAVMPDAGGVAADAGLWVPQQTGIVMPQSPLYFPFTTPWAADVSTAQAATGTGTSSSRTATLDTAGKGGVGAGLVQQRATTGASSGPKAAIGTGTSMTRAITTATSSKQAVAPGIVQQRSSTGAASSKQVTGIGTTLQRATATTTSTKRGLGAANTAAHTSTTTGGSKSVTGTATDQQRSVTASSGTQFTGKVGAGATIARSTTTAAGQKTGTATATATCRTSTGSSGTHRSTGTGTVLARALSSSTGTHRGTGTGNSQQRTRVVGTSVKVAVGPGRVQQRTATVAVHLLDQTPLRIRKAGREPATIAAGRENDTTRTGRENDTSVSGREQGTP